MHQSFDNPSNSTRGLLYGVNLGNLNELHYKKKSDPGHNKQKEIVILDSL